MKLHFLELRNVKAVEHRAIDFVGGKVTVISGKNEIGKTTMVQAFSTLLNVKSTSNKAEIKQLRPKLSGEDPQITAEFSIGDERIRLSKVFAGSRGKTNLRYLSGKKSGRALSGGDAENELEALLGGADQKLFDALNNFGSDPFSQKPFATSAALTRALQEASGGANDSDQSMVEMAKAHRDDYFTATGKARGEYSAAISAKSAAENDFATAASSLEEIADTERRLSESKSQIARFKNQLSEAKADLEDLLSKSDLILTAEADAQRAKEARDQAMLDYTIAQAKCKERAEKIDEQAAASQRLAETELSLKQLDESLELAKKEISEAEDRLELKAKELADSAQKLDMARTCVAAIEAKQILASDEKLLADIEAAQKEIAELDQMLSTGKLNRATGAKLLADINSAERERETARAKLEASSARLRVTSLGNQNKLLIDSTETEVTNALERNITSDVAIEVPGKWLFEIAAPAVSQFKEDASRAESAYAQALSAAGVKDAQEARELWQGITDSVAERELKTQRLQLLLSDRRPEDIRANISSQRAHLAALPADLELPSNLDAAKDALAEAASENSQYGQERETALAELTQANSAIRSDQDKQSELRGTLKVLADRRDELAKKLAAERLETPDEVVEQQLRESRESFRAAESALAKAQQLLTELDASGHRLQQETLEAKIVNISQTLSSHQKNSDELTGALKGAHADVRQHRYDETLSALEYAKQKLERIEVKANAAMLLYETLAKHLAEAQEKYRMPFTQKIRELGRAIYADDSFEVFLNEDLTIESRVLNGIRIDYEQLSSGAKEQLLILVKLAAAMLVDEADGMPIFLDDQLGHTDPSRQTRMAAILAKASEYAQLIVLTADEGRYAALTNRSDVRIS